MTLNERAKDLAERVLCREYIARDWDTLLAGIRSALAEEWRVCAQIVEQWEGGLGGCCRIARQDIASILRARATAADRGK